MNKLSRYVGLLLLTVVFTLGSCTDLTETVDDQVTSENFFQTDQEFVSALGDAYGPLSRWGGHNGNSSNNEISTDEMIVTQKGADWEDGGVWIRMKRHTFAYDDPNINNAWLDLYSGVNNCNRLIFQFESLVEEGTVSQEDAAGFIAELKVLRAFYYLQLLDNFGNVPIITQFEGADENPSQPSQNFQEGRTAVFNFVEDEVTANMDQLSEDVGSTYGRVNKWVAHMILAKLYLNAEVYTGTERWSDVVTQANAIIDSGNFSMAANYEDNFVVNNEGSPEFIFAVPYDQVFLQGFNMVMMTNHVAAQSMFELQAQPWNGYATMEEFYRSYIDPQQNPGPQGTVFGIEPTSEETPGVEEVQGTLDDRLSNFIVGPAFSTSGERISDDGATAADPNGAPISFHPQIFNLEPNGLRQAGARVGKFKFEIGATSNMNNDFPIYRYTDVLLMKAEALWRMDNSDAEALRLVNMVRNRAGVDDFNSLTADRLLAERGREMFYEIFRRQDLIRFEGDEGATEFNDSWKFKQTSPDWRNVFPIPRDQLEANNNLVQNPGDYQG
ncbi:RagB/SusD family nutrient uptake outer membrane protein [Aliifodinibius sp. S!AR15-10]|uniref:RagB/SusD family nutrient uptake outer membrane protein n=1 Tax=Aliifodinibius sp. S!AR15-10 TaxID=2950437 RepID=UPI0028616C4A|nr:RagB/SusD family nutrient uptake outer membrane protein [Aliifodinibius sp. S!AR15-10]MDR8392516.1 RagB/SusD family nutrient uptake outer membrane protein [Aliifodinibius sp. S!AR15-10]